MVNKSIRNAQKAEQKRNERATGREIGEPLPPRWPELRESCEFDLCRFLESYLAARFPLAWSADHLALIESIEGIILHGGLRALAMPRGSGKTTVVESAALWALLYGHRKFLFVVAATSRAAKQILRNIQDELAHNDAIAADFEDATRAIRALEGVGRRAEAQTCGGEPTHLVLTREEVRLPRTAAGGGGIIQSAGVTGAIRGAKSSLADGSQVRPDLCLVDDFQTRDSSKSPNQTASRLQVMQSDVLGLAGPGTRVACLCSCTIINRNDGAAQLLNRKLHPEWQGTTARLMITMPSKKAQALWDDYSTIYREDLARDDLKQDKKLDRANLFYRERREQMDDGAEAAWDARKSDGEESAIQHAMNLLITRGEDAFWAEFQNAPRDLAATETPQLQPEPITRRLNGIAPGIVPSASHELVAFVDVGEHVLWWNVGAFGDGFRGDLVSYGAYPDPHRRMYAKSELKGALSRAHPTGSIQATWMEALNALGEMLLDNDWPDEQGMPRRISLLLVDAGDGDATDTIFEWCKTCKWKDRVMPSRGKGIGAKSRPMADWPKDKGEKLGTDWRIRTNKSRKQKEVLIGVNYWKSFVAARLAAPLGGPSCLHLAGSSASAHELISHHLTAEKRVRVTTSERTIDEWVWKVGNDNDLLDTVVGLHVAASIRGITLKSGTREESEPERLSFAEQQRAAREKRRA